MKFHALWIWLLMLPVWWIPAWAGVEFESYGLGQRPHDYFGIPPFGEKFEQMLFHHSGFFSLYYFPAILSSPAYLLLQENTTEAAAVYILRGSPAVIREIYYIAADPLRQIAAKQRLQNDHGIILPNARNLGRLRNKFVRMTYPHLRPRRDQNNRPPQEAIVMATAKQGLRCKIGGFMAQLGPNDAAVTFFDPGKKICSMAVMRNSDPIDVIEEIIDIMIQEYVQEGGALFAPDQTKKEGRDEVTFFVGDKFKAEYVQQMERFLLARMAPPLRKDWWPEIVRLKTVSEEHPTSFLFSLENGAYFSRSCANLLK